ncbi:MAG: rhodanese-like domain-containing protein [Chloroflexi bacterium]|nr:MAG: rhodanese-like domain-containing protein [Chloroflexota bacterium]
MDSMSVNDMIADARTRITGLSKEEMQRELESGEAVVVDIRDVRERWRDGTIPGAKKRTIVYCAGGLRSSLAADVLQKMGYTNVAHLEMGFDGWKKAGGAWEEVPIPDEFRKG